MRAGLCQVCRRMKILVLDPADDQTWKIRSHSAEKDLTRFSSPARFEGPLDSPLCTGSRRAPLSVVTLQEAAKPAPNDSGAVVPV